MTERPESATGAGHARQPLRSRLLALVLHPTAPPLRWGIVVAVAFIVGETLLVLHLKRMAPGNAFGAIFLLGVLVVSAGWSFGLALATSLASAAVYVYFHLEGGDSVVPALFVFLPLALLANVLAGQARLRAAESEQRRREAAALAKQQAALRTVATLVARGADPAEVYPVAVVELAHGLDVEHVTLAKFESDDLVVLAAHDPTDRTKIKVGERLPLDGDSVGARIRRTGSCARIDDYADVEGALVTRLRGLGLRSGVGAPITVNGSTRGALIIGSAREEPMPAETEARICDFADLVATAVANAETRAELKASRARIVAAADQARRGIERDLHDGAQQRIVSLGLGLRTLEASIPEDQQTVRDQVENLVNGMADLYTDLQELSRGIHPAILSKGGLGPAIKTLARRSVVPVRLELAVDRRLPEPTEVAAYYVIAEALTNVAKHAKASEVTVHAGFDRGDLLVEVTDDGVGGAVTGGGSGLVGLKDRVEVVSGRLDISTPASGGTTVRATIPVDIPVDDAGGSN
jgi:signal transduction histidine kinase